MLSVDSVSDWFQSLYLLVLLLNFGSDKNLHSVVVLDAFEGRYGEAASMIWRERDLVTREKTHPP
ncbi:hypothetical protein NUACC21_22120 [Scytonema sp. NUACC21]